MRIFSRYRGKRSPSKGRDRWSWLFALLCVGLLVLLGWIGWRLTEFGRPSSAGVPARTNAPLPTIARTPPPAPSASAPPPRATIPPTQAVFLPPASSNVAKTEPANVIQRPPRPAPEPESPSGARPVQNVFEAQLAMARQGISCGSLDGGMGSQTRAALSTFQRKHGLATTGLLDGDTRQALLIALPLYTTYTVTSDDAARLRPLPRTWLGKSERARLDYETILELVAERSFSHPKLIESLNPEINWTNVLAGATVKIPRVEYPIPRAKAAWVRISLSAKTLEVFDSFTNLLAHFPCSIGRRVEKRPVGELRVVVLAPNPNYTFNPAVFPESEEGRQLGRKLVVPAGPNNPVGSAWIGLDRPGYGMHGTPSPELVGRTESHGCFRLANWNAEYLLKLVTVGTPVVVEP